MTKTGWPAAVKMELTRDKFVFGLLDDALKERLLEADLSLQRAIALAQRSESSKIKPKKCLFKTPHFSAMKLNGARKRKIRCLCANSVGNGTFRQCCAACNKLNRVKFYVVDVDSQPILGLQDCDRFGLIKRMNVINTGQLTKESIKALYNNVFTRLGKLGNYHITLQDGCTPVVHPPRCIPRFLKDRLQKAIEANVKSEVLVKVDQPTDWVHNLVIAEKKNGSLQLYLDPRALNDAIKREYYQIPTIQEIASDFAGKKVFLTLDLKDGYWQVELDEQSSLSCTFITPFGRYRFTRMPFGLKSASEIFQKKNEAAFEGIDGIYMVADDIIIAANDLEEHNAILYKVLQRASDRNIKLNFGKFQFCVNAVKYLGTIISHEGMKLLTKCQHRMTRLQFDGYLG